MESTISLMKLEKICTKIITETIPLVELQYLYQNCYRKHYSIGTTKNSTKVVTGCTFSFAKLKNLHQNYHREHYFINELYRDGVDRERHVSESQPFDAS